MIVQCNKCQTKFRIADEKVSANGVKVRCSRCAHVFIVRRDESGAPTTTAKVPTHAVQSFAEQTKIDRPDPPSGVPTIPSASSMVPGLPTQRSKVPSAATASSLEAAAALGFSGLPAPPKNPSLPPLDGPSGLPEGLRTFTKSEALTVRSGMDDKPSAFDAGPTDPFSVPPVSFNDGPTAPGANIDPRDLPPDPFAEAPTMAAGSPFTDVNFGSDGDPPPLAASDFESPVQNPFADPFATTEGDTSGLPKFSAAQLPSFPDASASIENSADRFPAPSDFDPNDPGFQTEMNLHGMDRELPNGPASSGNFPPPPPTNGTAASGDFPPLAADAALGQSADLGDIPGLMAVDSPADDDPFAGVDVMDAGSGSVGAYSDLNAGGDDIGGPPPATPTPLPSGDALARIDLGQAGMPMHGAHHEATAVARAYAPAGVRTKTGVGRAEGDGIGWWPTVVGIAAGLALAYLFVPGVQTRLAPLFGTGPGTTIGSSISEAVPGSVPGVLAERTFVRMYPTASGRKLLVVGGHARSTDAVGPLEAVVAVMDGDRVVERRTAPLGTVMDEAALRRATQAIDIDAAFAERTPAKLSPGEPVPFMVVFWTPPPAADDKQFRIAFVNAGPAARAANAP